MSKKVLYEARSTQPSLFDAAAPERPSSFYRTLPISNVSANRYGYLVYAGNWSAFVGYADVENPTAQQIRNQF